MSAAGPSDTTVRRLFAVSMNRCAFPGCETPVLDPTSNTILAEVCHIRARNERGPRYDSGQTDEERHGFDNLILMCSVHHKLIDAPENLHRFQPDALIAIKAQHEQEARLIGRPVVQLTEEQLTTLQSAGATYDAGATHNDFRHAVFRVGGEGGQWGGGGGGGGILTIVGTTQLPTNVNVDGQNAQAPGGGGAGAGSVRFVGRPVDTDDLAHDLRLCCLLLANAVSFSGSLWNALGAGWTYIDIPSTPTSLRIWLILTFECGDIEEATLLRVSVRVTTPSGAMAMECPVDIEVPSGMDLVKRASRAQLLEFEVTEHGLWSITVRSSTHELGTHHFECRK
jgi:hypothetical protein